MAPWKRALVLGSLGAGAVLFATGRRPAGIVLAGVGLTTLALEYPEQFERVWREAPHYLERGTQVVQRLSELAERVAEQAQQQGAAWRKSASDYVT